MARQKERQASALTLAAKLGLPKMPVSARFGADSAGNWAGSLPAGLSAPLPVSMPVEQEAAKARLGRPLSIRKVAALIGCSPWTVRQTLIPKGLPHFRSGASGRLIFYEAQIVRWIETQQEKGGKKR